jgi:hypothetical protein
VLLGAFGVFQGSFGLLVTRLQRLLAESLPVSDRANAFQEGYGGLQRAAAAIAARYGPVWILGGLLLIVLGYRLWSRKSHSEVAAAAALGLAVPALAIHTWDSVRIIDEAGGARLFASALPWSLLGGGRLWVLVSAIGTSAVISVPFAVLAVLVWRARPRRTG